MAKQTYSITGFGGARIHTEIVDLASGEAQFNTDLQKFHAVGIVQLNDSPLNERFSVSNSVTNGWVTRPANGKVTVKSSNGSSTAKVCVTLIGH